MITESSFQSVTVEQKFSLVLLVKEALAQIDEIASLIRHGHSAKVSRSMLRETLAVLDDLPPELIAEYLSTLLLLADKGTPMPTRKVSEEYAREVVGAKRKFIATVRDRLRQKAA